MAGMNIVHDPGLNVPEWQFPEDRFIAYGPEDEWWARKFGFGKEIVPPVAYVLKTINTVVCNTPLYQALKKELNANLQAPVNRDFSITLG